MYIFIFLTGIVDSCSQNTNMTCGKPTWSAAAGYYTTGSALLILPMVHWACGLLPWLSPPQETEVLIITYKRYSCFHRKTLRPSLVLSLYYPVLPLSPWWLLFVTWGKQTLAFLFSFHSRAESSANPKQNINPAHHYIWGFRRDSGCLDAVLKK